jgi:helix-turn-helix protein
MSNRATDKRPGRFIVDNAIIDDYHLTPMEGWLYIVIVRHADRSSGEAFPSIRLLAKETGMSKPSVLRSIEGLEVKKLIRVERSQNTPEGREVNHYFLLPTDLGQDVTPGKLQIPPPSQSQIPPPVSDVDRNKTHIEQDKEKDSSAPKKSADTTPRKANPNEPLFNALVQAFGLLPSEMKGKSGKPYWIVAADLKTQGIDVNDIPGLYRYVKNRAEKENWRGWTVMAIPKYVPDWRKAGQPSVEEDVYEAMFKGLKFIVAGED